MKTYLLLLLVVAQSVFSYETEEVRKAISTGFPGDDIQGIYILDKTYAWDMPSGEVSLVVNLNKKHEPMGIVFTVDQFDEDAVALVDTFVVTVTSVIDVVTGKECLDIQILGCGRVKGQDSILFETHLFREMGDRSFMIDRSGKKYDKSIPKGRPKRPSLDPGFQLMASFHTVRPSGRTVLFI